METRGLGLQPSQEPLHKTKTKIKTETSLKTEIKIKIKSSPETKSLAA